MQQTSISDFPVFILVSDDLQGVYICDMGISKLRHASQTSMTTVSKGPTGTFPIHGPKDVWYRTKGYSF